MSYAINNENGEHLGFLLLAGDGESGDCIFRSLPNKPELFETEESKLLSIFQDQGEFQWSITSSGLEINNQITGSKAIMNNGVLNINGYIFNVVDMGVS